MVEFEQINEPEELFRWFHEHCDGEMSMQEIAVRYNNHVIAIDQAMGGIPTNSFVQFTKGDIVSDDGQWYETNIIIRSMDKVSRYSIVFVMDANDQVFDVVYMGPEDPRVAVTESPRDPPVVH